MKIIPWLKKEPYHEFWTGLQSSYLKIYSWIICFDLFVLFCSAFCVFAFWGFVICWFLFCVVMLLWIVGLAMPTPWASMNNLATFLVCETGDALLRVLSETPLVTITWLWFAAWPKAQSMLLGFGCEFFMLICCLSFVSSVMLLWHVVVWHVCFVMLLWNVGRIEQGDGHGPSRHPEHQDTLKRARDRNLGGWSQLRAQEKTDAGGHWWRTNMVSKGWHRFVSCCGGAQGGKCQRGANRPPAVFCRAGGTQFSSLTSSGQGQFHMALRLLFVHFE